MRKQNDLKPNGWNESPIKKNRIGRLKPESWNVLSTLLGKSARASGTVEYLGVELEDALSYAEAIEIQRTVPPEEGGPFSTSGRSEVQFSELQIADILREQERRLLDVMKPLKCLFIA